MRPRRLRGHPLMKSPKFWNFWRYLINLLSPNLPWKLTKYIIYVTLFKVDLIYRWPLYSLWGRSVSMGVMSSMEPIYFENRELDPPQEKKFFWEIINRNSMFQVLQKFFFIFCKSKKNWNPSRFEPIKWISLLSPCCARCTPSTFCYIL